MEKKRRVKQPVAGMMPVKIWLSVPEACSYMDMSINIFLKLAVENNLTISAIGGKKYFKVDQLQKLIEENIISY